MFCLCWKIPNFFYSYFSTFYSCFLKVLKEKKWIWSRLKLFLGYRCRSYHSQKSTDMMTSSVQMLPWSPMSSGNLNCVDPGPLGIWTTFCKFKKANLVVSTWNLEWRDVGGWWLRILLKVFSGFWAPRWHWTSNL